MAIMLALAFATGTALVHYRRATQPHHPEFTLAEMQSHVLAHDAVIIDARNPSAFAAGRIPSAISLPASERKSRSAEIRAFTRAHHDDLLVVYCANVWCGQAEALQQWMADLGHPQVGLFPGGFDAWVAAGLPTDHSP